MSSVSSFPEEISQAQRLTDFLDGYSQAWTSVYQRHPDQDFTVFSVFASRSRQAEMLSRPEWDMRLCDGHPAFIEDRSGAYRYTRYGRADDMRPVVILSSHSGVLPEMLPQVLEEFRHFHNLWGDPSGRIHKKLHPDGSEEEVCKVTEHHVQIRTAYLRRFQAATQLCLARFVDSILNTPNHQQWTTEALAPLDQTERTGNYTWRRDIRLDLRPGRVSSRILAKTVAAPPPRDQCGAWPWDEPADVGSHRRFIVAETPTGEPIKHTCDPESLSSGFGISSDLPLGQLTPVFFERSVLQRYYADPQKYRVEDNSVSCGALWSLRIDNNHAEHVIVCLCYLGIELPIREQDHWKVHNIVPPGSRLSNTAYRRWIKGEWAEPDSPEWQFKHWYDTFRSQCRRRLGWDLWQDTKDDDGNPLLRRVRMPLTSTTEELNDQARWLHLLLVEAIDTERLKQELGPNKPNPPWPISLLEAWFKQLRYPHAQRDIALLHRIRELRNAASHRDGSNAASQKPVAQSDQQQKAADIFTGVTDMLRDLTHEL